MRLWHIVVGYFVIGILFDLLVYRSFFGWAIIFWLPLLLWHFIMAAIITLILVAFVIWMASLFIPDIGKFVTYTWKKAFG